MNSYLFYAFLLIAACLFAICVEKSKQKDSEFLGRMLVFMVLFIPAALRYNIGTDYKSYVAIVSSPALFENTEPLCRIICSIIYELQLDEQSFFIITSFITYIIPSLFLAKKGYSIKIFIYFTLIYFSTYDIVRNGMAISFLIVSLEKYLDRRYAWSLLLFLLSFFCHYSSIALLPLFLIGKFPMNRWILCLIISVVCYLILSGTIFLFLGTEWFIDSKYSEYLVGKYSIEQNISYFRIGVLIRLFLPICSIVLFFNETLKQKKSILIIFLCAYIVSFLLFLNFEIFIRLCIIYSLSFPIVYAEYYQYSKDKGKLGLYYRIVTIFISIFLFIYLIGENRTGTASHGYYPYNSIL